MRANVAVNIFIKVNKKAFWDEIFPHEYLRFIRMGIRWLTLNSINHHNRPNETWHKNAKQIASGKMDSQSLMRVL